MKNEANRKNEKKGHKMFEFLNDIGNYSQRVVARHDREDGITVSTVYSSDEGYETALLDVNGTYPVERYETKEQAASGHEKWVEFSKDGSGKTIMQLGGMGGLVGPEEIILET